MKGRPAKPQAMKDAQGNPGKRKRVDVPAVASPLDAKGLRAPSQLRPAAQAIWRQIAPELEGMRFLRPTDRHAFARYCETLVRWWDISKKLRVEGETYTSTSAHGELKRINPLVLVELRLSQALSSMEDRFGLNPSARQQILARLSAQQQALPFTPSPQAEAKPSADADPPPASADPMSFFTHQGPPTPQ